jgi:hypothetical protein
MWKPSTYIGYYDSRKLNKLLSDIAKAELELEQARLLTTPNGDLVPYLIEYLNHLRSRFHT